MSIFDFRGPIGDYTDTLFGKRVKPSYDVPKSRPVFRSFHSMPDVPRSNYGTADDPNRPRADYAPGVGDAIARRLILDGRGPMVYGACCTTFKNRYGGPTHAHPAVSVKRKRYDVIRERYRVTHDIDADKMPKLLYRHCNNPLCVNPYHYRPTVPKGRRGGKQKLSLDAIHEAINQRARGASWAAIGRFHGVHGKTVKTAVNKHAVR